MKISRVSLEHISGYPQLNCIMKRRYKYERWGEEIERRDGEKKWIERRREDGEQRRREEMERRHEERRKSEEIKRGGGEKR